MSVFETIIPYTALIPTTYGLASDHSHEEYDPAAAIKDDNKLTDLDPFIVYIWRCRN